MIVASIAADQLIYAGYCWLWYTYDSGNAQFAPISACQYIVGVAATSIFISLLFFGAYYSFNEMGKSKPASFGIIVKFFFFSFFSSFTLLFFLYLAFDRAI